MSLSFYPNDTLCFYRPLNNEPIPLKISNPNAHAAVFRVRTTAPTKYIVNPNIGILKPGQTVELAIRRENGGDEAPLSICKDKFLIQSRQVISGKANEAVSETFWSDPQTTMYAQELRVVYAERRLEQLRQFVVAGQSVDGMVAYQCFWNDTDIPCWKFIRVIDRTIPEDNSKKRKNSVLDATNPTKRQREGIEEN